MMTNQPASITRIPTAAFWVATLLYGCGFGLHVLFPIFGDQYLLKPFAFAVRPLAVPPRRWGLILSFVINLAVSAFALWMTRLVMTFPTPD